MNAQGLVARYLKDRLVDAFEDENLSRANQIDAFLIVVEGMEDHEFQTLDQEDTVTL